MRFICVPLGRVAVLIPTAVPIVKDRVFVIVTAGVAESATVITAENGPLTAGVPVITPVAAEIDKPPGNPVADQL